MHILNILESIGALFFVVFFIGLCIFSHELGHFLAARWRKLHIDAFSIGFRKVWAKKINGVEYRIGCIPLGGYVELPQVDATDEIPKSADGTELQRAKPLDRIITAVAGPLFNVIFGLLLGCVVWIAGLPQESPKMSVMEVTKVAEDSPEYRAGLRPGDRIVRLNGEKFHCTWLKFVEQIMFSVGDITLDVERNGKIIPITYTPIDNPNAPGRLAKEKIGYPFFTVLTPIELRPLPGSIAERAGIRKGDILYSIDGNPISSFLEFQMTLNNAGDRTLHLQIDRHGKKLDIPIQAEPVPDLPPEFITYRIGVSFQASDQKPTVLEILPYSPAVGTNLAPGDLILAVNGEPVVNFSQVIQAVRQNGTKPMTFTVQRGDQQHDLTISPEKIVPRTIGVELVLLSHPTPFEQFENILVNSYKSLRGMLVNGANSLGLTEETSTLKPRHMSGPLGMGTILYSSVKDVSLVTGIYFVVMISFALAIFNLLPLPVLDGGHIAFAVIELIFRRPLPTVVIKGLSALFIGLLVALMLYVTYFDILRLMPARTAPAKDTAAVAIPSAAPTAPAQEKSHHADATSHP